MKCACGWQGELAMILYDGPIGLAQTAPLCLTCRLTKRMELRRGGWKVTRVVPCRT